MTILRRIRRTHERAVIRLARSPALSWLPTPPLWALWAMQALLWVGLGLTLYALYRSGGL